MVSRGLAMAVFAFSIAAFIPCISAQTRKTMRIDEKSDGREVSMRLGETLEITLSENASTGFRWGIPEALKNNLAPALREREETVEAPETGEVIRIGSAGVAFDVVNGAEERLAAVGGAGVCRREEGVRGRVRDGRRGLGVRRFVTERDAGVGAEEGKEEEAGEEFEGASGIVEAGHFTGRGMRVGGGCRVGEGRHGSFRLGTASHGWVGGGAGSWKKYAVRCARKADSRRE